MAPDLVVHLGLRESGPVRLQQALGRLRPQLHRCGVGLVAPAEPADPRDRGRLARDGAQGADGDPAPGTSLAARVRQEAAHVGRGGHGPRAVVVCSERLLEGSHVSGAGPGLCDALDLAAIREALAACGGARARAVLYIRRQDRLMELSHLRAVRQGRVHDFAQLPQAVDAAWGYEQLVGWLQRLPCIEDVVVRPFELVASSAARHARDFLVAAGLDGELDVTAVGTDLAPDPVYSAQACRIAVDVASLLESERERRLVDDFLITRFAAADDESTRFLSDRQRARILEAHAPANRALFRQRMPDLPDDAYTSDEATLRLAALGDAGHAATEARRRPARSGPPHGPGRLRRWAMTAAPLARLKRSGVGDGGGPAPSRRASRRRGPCADAQPRSPSP